MNNICIYLRKSRADEELEKTLGKGETLIKHRKALLKFAKQKNLNIVEIKEELVSADSIFHRPKMVELLQEVENKQYSGVLVMDIQRLGRGDTEDQGVITRIFKESHTKVITPNKTYDLDDDYDEDYFEFESFMGRKEYKMIKKRMQGGRIRSIEDGNYIATNPPLGYDIHFINRSRTLKINENEAEIIKTIFNMYINGNGASSISNYLNSLGYKTKIGNSFSPSSVLMIIKNPVYIGKVTWKKKEIKKSKDPNKVKDTRTRDKSEWLVADGKHEAIIDIDIWNRTQEILNNRYHIPYQLTNAPVNPFAGLITCGICGKKMTMRKLRGIDRLMCTYKCGNRSIRFEHVEKEVLKSLRSYLEEYKMEVNRKPKKNDIDLYVKQITLLNKELNTLNNQKLKLFDFLERGIYSEDVFLERSKNIESRMTILSGEIEKLEKLIKKEEKTISQNSIVVFENIIDAYEKTNDISLKNRLLKQIVYKIEYFKRPDQKNDDFKVAISPKLLR